MASTLPVFKTDLFRPDYRPMTHGDWEIRVAPLSLSRGYWSGPVLVENMAVLLRRGESWMSITPFEVESQEIGIRLARGHVLIFGLGMGWAAAAAACMPAVEAVTIVELDPDLLSLHRKLDLFAQLPEMARAKLSLLPGNALAYVPESAVDLLMPDIWKPLVSDGRLEEVRSMQSRVAATSIYFWGQEMELARRAVAAGRALDDAGIAATIAETGLPLIGLESPDYSARLAAAARHWMDGRWLPAPANS